MNNLIVKRIATGEKYAVSCKDYFTCSYQFDGTELKENGEPFQILVKTDIEIIGELDNNGEEIIY